MRLAFVFMLVLFSGCLSNRQSGEITATTGIPFMPHISVKFENEQVYERMNQYEKGHCNSVDYARGCL